MSSNSSSALSTYAKYGSYAAVAYAVFNGVNKLQELDAKTVTESQFYAKYKAFCLYLVNSGYLGQYVPKGINGKALSVPSAAPVVYAEPPKTISESRILTPMQLRKLRLRNRVIRAAAFDGANEEEIMKTHVDQSKGGVGMTTVAYCCVLKGGLTFEEQMVMEEGRRGFLEKLTSKVHEHGAAICAQLTHAGGFADREVTGEVQLSPSGVFNIAGLNWPKAMDDDDLKHMKEAFANAAILAKETGFDCIEVHCGHGYLLSQFLSPRYNSRSDKYGGSDENRARFPAEVVQSVRKAVGEDFPIVVKLNMHDGNSNGMELEGSIVAANMLADASADALIMTCGNIILNGFYMLRGGLPMEKLIQAMPTPIERVTTGMFGPVAIPLNEYDDCFLRESAREVLKAVGHRIPIVLMGGVSSLAMMEGALEEGFEAVQIARTLIREPDFVNRITATLELNELIEEEERQPVEDIQSKCIRCNMCVIATVDPNASFGCPFQKREGKMRVAKGNEEILSVPGMKAMITGSPAPAPALSPLSMNQVNASSTVDIEDLFLSPKL